MVRRQAFSTGRAVRLADQVLSLPMFRVHGVVTPSLLTVLASKTDHRYAKAKMRLVAVLPWLQAHVAPPPANRPT